jgi:hypothetical protein
MKDLKDMGEITVKGYFVISLRPSEEKLNLGSEKCASLESIPEKALKGRALSHKSE